uniref:Transferred entry: 7.6.2.2 n=1 Tax=Strongyloides papillosus TaxID=174720 RepID=A0A0N5BVD9_STREA
MTIKNDNKKNNQNGKKKKDPATALDMDSVPVNEDEEDKGFLYEPSLLSKILNYFLCNPSANVPRMVSAKPVTLFGLFRYANKIDIILLAIGFVTTIFSGLAQPVMAIISGRITNNLLTYPSTSWEFRIKAYENVYIFLGIGVFTLFNNFIQFMTFSTVCNRIVARIRKEYLRSILRQNAGWFDKTQAGVLTTRLNDNVDRIREGLGDKLGLLLRGAWMYVSAVVIAFSYEWRTTLMMLGVAPATCVCMALMSQLIGFSTMNELMNVGQAGAIAEETILAVRTVQSFNGQEERIEKYRNALLGAIKHSILSGLWSGLFGGLFFFILITYLGCGMCYGGYLLSVGIFGSPGDVFIVVMSMLLGAYFLGLVSPHLTVLLNARVSASTLYNTIDRVPPIDCYSKKGKVIENVIGKVQFKNVHFRYPTRKDQKILHGIDFEVNPGETVALVGHSGCGKSTSVGLITRLYEPEEGSVTIDNVEVRDLNIDWLRNIVGIVQQEPILFSDTLAENLRMGNPNITHEQMIEVCKMANAHEFIENLPDKYETLIGEGGVQLSGGQKQRIAIARTLARDPKILLLDEATSALDTQSESIVQSALNNAAKGRSTIVIAHRLSTIKTADKIIVFEKGNIIEQGTHSELVKLNGKYAQLVKAQQFTNLDGEEDNTRGGSEDGESRVYRAEPVDYRGNNSVRSSISSIQSSIRSGRDAFMRADANNQSFRVQSALLSDMVAMDPQYALNAINELEELDESQKESSANILTVYKEADGYYGLLLLGLGIAILRGFELPGLGLLFTHVFRLFQAITIAYFAACGAGTFITQLLSSVIYAYTSGHLTLKYRVLAFSNILYQDASFFDKKINSPGELITRLAADVPNIRALLDGRMLQILYGITSIVTCIILSYIYTWQVSTLGVGLLIILGVSQITLSLLIQNKTKELMKNDEAGKISIEAIENVKTVQLLTRCDFFIHIYNKAVTLKKKNEFQRSKLEAINYAISQTFQYFILTVVYAIGIHVIYMGHKPPQDVFQGVIFMLLGSVAVMNAASYFPEVVKANTSAKTLFKIIRSKPLTGDHMAGEKHQIRGNIMFDNIKFTYPARKNQIVMNGLHFSIQKGQTVALVGPSGSGGAVRLDGNAASYFPEVVKANTSAKTLFKIIRSKPLTGDHMAGEKHQIRGNIMFDNIKFTYPARKNQIVMNGLHFSIQKGQTVALVGPSGSGKSTTISMLERFYDPSGGAVRLDGKDLKSLSLYYLRTQMALVGQEPRLFSGTIKENICFGLKNVSQDKIDEALELSNSKNFISLLPEGINTEVGEKGSKLSGGQKQRIAIARALVRDPKILLLDEATSALDSESERAVQEALDKARLNRTCVTIAHRLSSIQNSDLIVYIAEGQVKESGTHNQLLAKKGNYWNLIQQQNL